MFGWFKKKGVTNTPNETVTLTEDYSNPDPLIDMFREETGITFENQRSIAAGKLTRFCKMRRIPSFELFAQELQHDALLRQELVNYLTTNESYFYREFTQINTLINQAVKLHRPVSILCAPCATGEEPYTIALALLEAGVQQFDILGIDINTQALAFAKEAIYSERSVRNIPPDVLSNYFIKADAHYTLSQRVTHHVRFENRNLFDSDFASLGRFDFVLSRNMLIYFDQETKRKASAILESMRKDASIPVIYGHADLF